MLSLEFDRAGYGPGIVKWAGFGHPGKRRLRSMLGADGLLFYLYLFRDRLVFYEFKLGFVSLSVKTTSYKYVTIPDE